MHDIGESDKEIEPFIEDVAILIHDQDPEII